MELVPKSQTQFQFDVYESNWNLQFLTLKLGNHPNSS
jgi:hypothetical protein